MALSALDSFFARAERGEFAELNHGTELWKMLVVITARKASNYNKYTHRDVRGGGRITGDSGLERQESNEAFGIEQISDHAPTPEFVVSLDEECEARLDSLADEMLRQIAVLRLEGNTVQEIADALQISKRTIERKITLIRAIWSNDKPGVRPKFMAALISCGVSV